MRKLTDLFIYELFKLSTTNKTNLELVQEHFSYTYIESTPAKKCFKALFDYYNSKKFIPSFGILSELIVDLDEDGSIKKFLEKSQSIKIKEDDVRGLFDLYQTFLIDKKFLDLYEKTADLYGEGKTADSIQLLEKESKKINEFKLYKDESVEIYSQYEDRQLERDRKALEGKDASKEKIITGIPQIDYILRGGVDKGTGTLFTARSGVGKSTFLRSVCFVNSIQGKNSVYIHAEDTKTNVELYFDAMWSNISFQNLKENNISDEQRVMLNKSISELKRRAGKIHVLSYSGLLGSPSIIDVFNSIKDLDIELAAFDYLELFSADGSKYSQDKDSHRNKKLHTANKICALALEKDIATFTATQVTDMPASLWNDPEFVIDRGSISENKQVINPFSYHLTGNQTTDEYDEGVIRTYLEKARHAFATKEDRVAKTAMDRAKGKYVDKKKTYSLFWDRDNNCAKI